MKVLFVTSTYPTPAQPRQGAFNHVLVEALRSRHEVCVIAPVPWPQALRAMPKDGRKSSQQHFPTYYYPPKLLRRHYGSFYWHSIRRTIIRATRSFSPDLVIGYWLHPDCEAAVDAAEMLGIPAIVISGGTDLRRLPQQAGRRRAIRNVLDRADRIVVLSRELASHAKQLDADPNKIDVIYRGVDRRCFYPGQSEPARQKCNLEHNSVVLLWAGRMLPVKNPAMLLHATVSWSEVWGERLRVVMAGEGALKSDLMQLRQKLGLANTVQFVGDVSQPELAEWFNAADVSVLTSLSEGTPNVLLESIACETPFVATNVGGIPEIATPGLDHLVNVGDCRGLVDAVIRQIEAPSRIPRRFLPSDSAEMAISFESVMQRTLAEAQGFRGEMFPRSCISSSRPDLKRPEVTVHE